MFKKNNNKTKTKVELTDTNQSKLEQELNKSQNDLTRSEKYFGALSYFGFFAIITLIFAHDSRFAAHHARQGLILAFIFWLCERFFFFFNVGSVLIFFQLVLAIILGLRVLSGSKFKFPWIHELADNIANSLMFQRDGQDKKSKD